ncbi:MAG: TRAP transporter large permease [Proteobacteria bacterium]|nr:MAG: TRAP transporter large permease [Pseudomonadota bacterium]
MSNGALIAIVTAVTVVQFLLGVPIFLVISVWVIGVSLAIDFTLANFGVTLFEGLSSFALLALPLFILAGDLMKETGIAKRLADFAFSMLGWLKGGLALSTIGASGLFSAVSGSNSATTAAIGSIMYPELRKQGYDGKFAAATIASGGIVGIIIPPSIVFIVYGVLLNLPVGDLFLAGLIPGVLLVVVMQGTAYLVSKRNGWGAVIRFEPLNVARQGLRAYLGILAIVIVLFGIYSGIFSPTEAAGITVGFTILAGLLVARSLRIRELPKILVRASQLTAMLAPMVAVSIVLQQMFGLLGVQQFVTAMLDTLGNYYAILFACMVIVLISGTVLESIPNTIIFAPILAPIAVSAGVDPIHFAVVFLVGDAIGFITPPYGLNLYVASGLTGIPYLQILRSVIPYLVAVVSAWFVIAIAPWMTEITRLQF